MSVAQRNPARPRPGKALKRILLAYLAPIVLVPVVYLYTRTWRFRLHGPDESIRRFIRGREAVIFAHWHGDELALAPYYTFKRLAVLTSLSTDGTIMASVLRLLGYRVFRGSSSRGGARGLLALIRCVAEGGQAALAVDGPRGPRHEVKAGIVELCVRTGRPVVAARTSSRRAWYIPKAWNRAYIPKPFAIVDVHLSDPLLPVDWTRLGREQKAEAVGAFRLAVQERLTSLLPE
jgi:hypothetical protein